MNDLEILFFNPADQDLELSAKKNRLSVLRGGLPNNLYLILDNILYFASLKTDFLQVRF